LHQPPAPTEQPAVSKTGGTRIDAFNEAQLRSLLACLQPHLGPDQASSSEAQTLSAIAALRAFEPRDAIEGMIAAQAVGAHHTAMECLRRACQPGESPEVASRLHRDAAAMSRSFADLVTTLERRRDRTARQVIRVERVVVEAGGQAIVGAVGMAPAPAGGHP
jgi:hypothetical protein